MITKPLHVATVGKHQLRFFKTPNDDNRPDLPWHAVDDLQQCLGLGCNERAIFQKIMWEDADAEERAVSQTVATEGKLITIQPHFLAQAMIEAMIEAGQAPASIRDEYAFASAAALKKLRLLSGIASHAIFDWVTAAAKRHSPAADRENAGEAHGRAGIGEGDCNHRAPEAVTSERGNSEMDRVLEPGETLELLGAMGAQMEQKQQELLASNEQLIAAQKRYIDEREQTQEQLVAVLKKYIAEQKQCIVRQEQTIECLRRALLMIMGAARDNASVVDPALAQVILDASRMCTDLAAGQARGVDAMSVFTSASEQHTED
jgi:hypothetical protein